MASSVDQALPALLWHQGAFLESGYLSAARLAALVRRRSTARVGEVAVSAHLGTTWLTDVARQTQEDAQIDLLSFDGVYTERNRSA